MISIEQHKDFAKALKQLYFLLIEEMNGKMSSKIKRERDCYDKLNKLRDRLDNLVCSNFPSASGGDITKIYYGWSEK